MMHTMMINNGPDSPLLMAIQMLCCALCLGGFILLLVWAAKSLTHKQLQTWGAGLLVGGLLVCLLLSHLGAGRMYGKSAVSCTGENGTCMMQEGMMKGGMMMKDHMMGGSHMMPDGSMMMNGGMAGMDHDSMTMGDMVDMLKGKTGDAFDQAFLEGMIPHHQGAVDMANLVLRDAKHEELKQLARDIITSQQKEIDMMKQWQKTWGYVQ